MHERLAELEARFEELTTLLSDPEVASDHRRMAELARERSQLEKVVELGRRFRETEDALADARELLRSGDDEERDLGREEEQRLAPELERLEQELKLALLPRDPADERDVIIEIRAGTGGEEAALFAADLFRMYQHYAERRRWKIGVLNTSEASAGGYKEITFELHGQGAYSRMKYESGVHRVQRVPETESQGRIHTSTVTVAVLPEAAEVDVVIDDKDLRVDVYRSSGPSGQSVNTTDSAVRITHLPTNLVVTCQDEKSQHKNKARALKILRSRLLDLEIQRQQAERADERRGQIGTGQRSERIRTYNFPQNRVTDHRVSLTLHKLGLVMEGELDELFEGLEIQLEAEAMAAAGTAS